MLEENETGDGGFITEDGGFIMTESAPGLIVEDGVSDALGLRAKDLKKLVIEFEGRRRFGILNLEEEVGLNGKKELGVVESAEETESGTEEVESEEENIGENESTDPENEEGYCWE
jgi:hypothetical protein